MILASVLLLGVVAAYAAFAGYLVLRLGVGYRQALLYAPFKLVYRIADRQVRTARRADAPVIYAVVHRSRLDPALMLALLPQDTLHILDPESANAGWLEPWRTLARTIPFNAEHVFVSRRLVRHLRGRGRLAVYIPDAIEPDAKAFRLHRAIARIAVKAEARIVPIFVGGAHQLPMSCAAPDDVRARWLPKLSIGVMEPATIAELSAHTVGQDRPSNTLFDRLAEARIAAGGSAGTLFRALREAAYRHGTDSVAVEDVLSGSMTYRRLFIAARALGSRFRAATAPGDAVGLMIPNTNALAVSLLGLFSASRAAAMINYTAGPAAVTAAIRTAMVRTVITSRAFVAKAELSEIVEAAARGGAKVLYLEDLQRTITVADQVAAVLLWRKPLARQARDKPAVILFTSGSEGSPKAVALSHRNILANIRQVESRLAFSPRDKLLNVLPAFHCFGLTGGVLLPLHAGVRLFLYPSPLHYKLVPETAARERPTILVGTDTFLAGYARNASDSDFSSLRLVVAGAEPVKAETRRVWRARFGAEIVEGFGLTEAAPVVAVNSATHGRDGTVGRLLPGMRSRLEPVEGIADGGRLWLAGPNLMMGYMSAERPGDLQPLDSGWHDTGDIVSIDRDGYITIRGRARRFAKIGGEMVSLGAVEILAQQLWPDERHAAVSVPDERRGEAIVLVTTADPDVNLLRHYAKKSGASALSVPQDMIKVDEIPLLGTGKTDHAGVRRIAMERLGLKAAA